MLTLSNASLDSLVVAPHSGVHSLTGRAAPADARFAASHSLGNAATAAAVPAASERVPHCATTAASDVALAQATAKPFAPVDGSLAPLAAREDRALESSAHVPALEDAPADELDEVMLKVRLNEAELLHAVFLYELATHEAEERRAVGHDVVQKAPSAADASPSSGMITITNRPSNCTARAAQPPHFRLGQQRVDDVRAVSHRRPCPHMPRARQSERACRRGERGSRARARGFSEHDHSQIELCFMMYCSVCRETREGSVRTV